MKAHAELKQLTSERTRTAGENPGDPEQILSTTALDGGAEMNAIQRRAVVALTTAMLLGLSGCADMSRRDRDTAIGAGIGAVGGAILTNGSALGTVGGAAVGGVIGNQVGKDRR